MERVILKVDNIFYNLSGSIADDRERDNLRATIAKQDALIEYLSMMTDVDLPTEYDMEEGMENESEI